MHLKSLGSPLQLRQQCLHLRDLSGVRGPLRRTLGLLRGDLAGLSRAAVIVIGLAWTTAGYVRGVVSGRPAGRSRMPR